MKTPRKASPARSQGPLRTPIRHKPRRALSVSSARSSGSVIISALTQHMKNDASFVVSPLGSRKSILSDNTEIEEPRRKSWWTNLGEHSTTSRDIVELLEANENLEPNNIIEELDMEILSQENKKNYTMDLPESSDSESINSIVITQRKLFPQKKQNQKNFAQIVGPRESLAKQHVTGVDKTLITGTRELFQNKQRSRPIFPAALLNISHNKTDVDKTKELAIAEPKAQVRNIFGQRSTKRKNIFNNFIVTESDDEISDIQPKVFGFQKTNEARRSSLRGIREPSPASSITTDMEMDEWKMLPSSTMVENQLEVLMTEQTPKRARLSNLTEMESEARSNASKQSNKSNSSKEDKSRKSKTFTKEKKHGIDLKEIVECDNESAGNIDKSRKSKTFTKEKACENESNNEMINKSTTLVDDNENQNKSLKDTTKSRKSKTFTKEKACEKETNNEMINKSTTLVDDNENQNKSLKDTTKSRKSKTFGKEIGDLDTSGTTKNNSKVQPDDKIENKSKTKISEYNTSIKTRSQSKNASPNNSQVIEEADLKSQTINKIKTMSHSKNIENIQEDNPSEEEKNDEEQNFSLHYENDDEDVVPMIIETGNKSMISKSMTQKDIINTDSGKEDKSIPNKAEESATVESSQDKNISNEENIETNLEQGDQSLHVSGNDSDGANSVVELEPKTINKSKDTSIEIENEAVNEIEVALDEVDNVCDNEEETAKQNESEAADEIDNDDDQEKNVEQNEIDNDDNQEKNVEQNETDNASDIEVHDLSLELNQSEPENESQAVEDDNEENQNESHAVSDTELNESKVQSKSDGEQNESQIQNESNTEQNETNVQEEDSEVEHNESEDEDEENDEEQEEQDLDVEQNVSDVQDEEQNESEHENEEESDAVIESGNENEDNPDNSQAKDSENQEESGQLEIIETPNVSHDTTGRNRKKNKSPEAVLHDSRNVNDSYFSVKGDKTVRKTEMPKSTHRDLVPARESGGFSDGSISSAQGSGWDSHRTTRKTMRLTYGRDFTPRKSLRALVMEKSAKRQTQHNEMASVTAPMFPQANSTEMPSIRFDDDDEDENRSPNDISLRTRQTTIEKYLMGVAKMNAERRQKIEEKVLNSLNEPPKLNIFKIPSTPLFARKVAPKPKQSKSAMQAAKVTKLFGELPPEVLEDLMYKPPKRFQPRDAPWATKHLYKFLEEKLEPKYQYKARVRAERLVEHVYNFTKDLRRRSVAAPDAVEVLKREMARLGIVKTHHEFYEFFGQFMPRDVRRKVMPDLINNIDLPRQGVFSDIM